MHINELKPIIFRGKVAPKYFIDKDGNPYSTQYGSPRKLSPSPRKNGYLGFKMQIEGRSYSVDVHRVVCETHYDFPPPRGISESDWKRTPKSVKAEFFKNYEVNHINHNKLDNRPENLEWVTRQENLEKSNNHYNGNKEDKPAVVQFTTAILDDSFFEDN